MVPPQGHSWHHTSVYLMKVTEVVEWRTIKNMYNGQIHNITQIIRHRPGPSSVVVCSLVK